MTFTLRPTTPADIPTLHRLMRDFAAYEKLQHRFRITEAGLHDALFADGPADASILAEIDGTTGRLRAVVLTFGTFSGRRNLFVEDIYVEPAHRGRGIGLALFRHMARIAVAARLHRHGVERAGLEHAGDRVLPPHRRASRCAAGSRSNSAATRLTRWPKEQAMADQTFDLRRRRRRPRRLRRRDPRRATRHEDRGGGARAPGRHLPQLGLHSDQGVAAHLRDQPPAAPSARFRFCRRRVAFRDRQGGEALARGGEAAVAGRGASAAQEQGHGVRRHRQARGQADARGGEGRQAGGDTELAAHHPGDRRARPRSFQASRRTAS